MAMFPVDENLHTEQHYHQTINNARFGQSPFRSFWMGGFECTDKLNAFGNRVDLLNATGHLQDCREDYQNLGMFKIKTVREGIRWSQVERTPYQYDWSAVRRLMEAAAAENIQQVWDICHFGFPDDLTPLHPLFPRRFAALCTAFVKFYRSIDPDGELIVTPINEVSFLSWLGGDVRGTAPFCVGQGWEVKYRLMKAYIEGIEALKEADPRVRILTTEPLINIVPIQGAGIIEIEHAATQHDHQFQVTDILSGRMCPELRGKPEYLDILGYNYYYDNQYVQFPRETLPWLNEYPDDRFIPLHQLIAAAYQRYQRPIVLSETSHPAEDRPLWITHIAEECSTVIKQGIPFWGICWYPVIDRPDWDYLHTWHQSGIWDAELTDGCMLRKVLHTPTADAFHDAQDLLSHTFQQAGLNPAVFDRTPSAICEVNGFTG
jgi:hypothetical protein